MNPMITATKKIVIRNVAIKNFFSNLRCMKYSNTKLDFVDAINRAIQMFNQPKSNLDAVIVSAVSMTRTLRTPSSFL